MPHKIHHIVHYYGEVDDEEVNIKPKEQKNNIHIEAPYNDVSKHLQDVAKNRANVGHIFVSFGGKDYDIRGAFNPDAYVRSKMKIEESGIITLRDINDLRKLNKYTSFYESASSTELRGLMKLENDIYEFLKKTL